MVVHILITHEVAMSHPNMCETYAASSIEIGAKWSNGFREASLVFGDSDVQSELM